MLRGITELQNLRAAILTIPANQLPIIAVSYSRSEASPEATEEANRESPNAAVSAARLSQARRHLNLHA